MSRRRGTRLMTKQFDGSDHVRINAQEAQSVQFGNHGHQISVFLDTPTKGAENPQPTQPSNETPTPRPPWLHALEFVVRVVWEIAKTLWAPFARGLANRQRRGSTGSGGRTGTAAGTSWNTREVIGCLLWVVIALMSMSQCQPWGAAPSSPPNGTVRFSDTFDAGSPGWSVMTAGQPPMQAPLTGTLTVT